MNGKGCTGVPRLAMGQRQPSMAIYDWEEGEWAVRADLVLKPSIYISSAGGQEGDEAVRGGNMSAFINGRRRPP